MAGITTTLVMKNHEEYARSLVRLLSNKVFNILVEGKNLKFCGRKLAGSVLIKNGQVSIPMVPGGSLAWDLNAERVAICFKANGDIELVRIFGLEKKKTILITQNPI